MGIQRATFGSMLESVLVSHYAKNNVDSKEFICEYFCNSKEFTNRLHRIFSFLEKYPNDFYQIIENEVIFKMWLYLYKANVW